ncbi:MAG: hypothetical protein LBJ76_05230 [Candidatus Accumulibacter sp.]|jgi:hypothetical protein|nr:hypothetical protein [Accumulibacter sp.]
MKKKSKKIAAALAAVEAYIQEEYTADAIRQCPPPSSAEPTAWALSARLDMMSGRKMMQFRAFSNIRR